MLNYGKVTEPKDIPTKEYVDNAVGSISAGDMLKSKYATKSDTIVDESFNSQSLNGKQASDFLINVAPGAPVKPLPIDADTLQGIAASGFVQTSEASEFVKKTEVVNTLTSTSTNTPLSANQGRVLNSSLASKASLASPTFTGTPKGSANTSYTTAQFRNVIYSTVEPTSSQGNNGDLWIVYEA